MRPFLQHATHLAAIATLATATGGALAQSTGRAVFVVNNVSDDVTSFTMNSDGTLEFVGNYPAEEGPYAADVSPNGRWLAVTHGTQNDVVEWLYIFEVNSDASLTLAGSELIPDSPLDCVWLNDEILAATETSFSDNFVRTWHFDPDTGNITEVDSEFTGGFNTALELHPSLPVLYAQDSNSNQIRAFEFDANGNLTSIGQVTSPGVYPLDPAMLPNGEHMYAGGGISSGGHAISGFDVDMDGLLSLVDGSPFTSPGQSPAYLKASSDSKYLFVGHGTDATVRTFEVLDGGALESTGFFFDVGLQGTVGDVEVLGDYLLITDESSAIDGVKGIYSFAIDSDGSFEAVADIYDFGGVRPERIVPWDPPATVGDINGDGVVDVEDLLILLGDWGESGSDADLDGSGTVDVEDLLILLANWS
jgi:6-phosphogluconolactonase (cycloisomerase 2 family)